VNPFLKPLAVKLAAGGGAALVLAGIFYGLLVRPNQRDPDKAGALRTAVVQKGDIVDRIKLRGKIVASKQVPIFSETSGQVVKLYVQEGDAVRKDQMLLRIDPTQLVNDIERQRMLVQKSEISMKNADEDYKRKEALYREHFIPESEWTEAKKARELSKIDYDLANKELDGLAQQLGKVNIKSPLDGIVTKKNVEEGEVVGGTPQNPIGKMLLTVTDAGDKKIEVKVTDVERQALKAGVPVEFWLDTDPRRRFRGTVSRVGASAAESELASQFYAAAPFKAEIDIEKTEADMPLGAGANVEIVRNEAKGVLAAPIEAVFHEGPESFVYLVKRRGHERRPVKTGTSNLNSIEIKEGLAQGEKVYLDEPS